jgi:hypothetical protein
LGADAIMNAWRHMHVMHRAHDVDVAIMMARVGCIAADDKTGCDAGKSQDTIAEPIAGPRTHPPHHAPRP